jgi:hypothetical protein
MRVLSQRALSLSDAEYATRFAELAAGTPDERVLALHLAVVRRDLDVVERALADPVLRRRALSAAVRLPVSDSALSTVIETAPRRDRVAAYGVLRLSRRRELADRLVETVHESRGRQDVAELLPSCSEDVVARWLPRIGAGPVLLRRLVRVSPRVVAEFLAPAFAAANRHGDRRWLREYQPLLVMLVAREPVGVAAIIRQLPRSAPSSLPVEIVPALLCFPDFVPLMIDLGIRNTDEKTLNLTARARRTIADLDLDQTTALIISCEAGEVRASLLAAVSAGSRREVVDRVYAEGDMRNEISAGELRLLSRADRVELGERLLREPFTRLSSWRLLEISRGLPYEQAAEVLREATGKHVHQQRRMGWSALIECAAIEEDWDVFARAVADAGRAWSDQDRVRIGALKAASRVPSAALSAVSLESLRRAVLSTTSSSDGSSMSFAHLDRWLVRTVTAAMADGDADRVVELHRLLTRLHDDHRARAKPYAPERIDGVGAELWPGLRERVLEDAESGKFDLALRVAWALGGALASVPELDVLVGRIACTASGPDDAATAARLWIAAPSTREARAGELVAHHPDLGRVDDVWTVIATRRTDLLDRLLSTGRLLPPVGRSVRGRWTPEQRARAEAVALSVASDEQTNLDEREAATGFVTDVDALTVLAETGPQRVAAAALTALAESASAELALPVLMHHGGKPVGPVAAAAVRGLGFVADRLPDNELAALAGAVLAARNGSVGGAKEAARLLGRARPKGAVEVLLRSWANPEVHQDVRAAVVVALTGFLGEDPRVAEVPVQAIANGDPVRSAVLAIRPDVLSPSQKPLLAVVIGAALERVGSVPRELSAAYFRWWTYDPEADERLARLVVSSSERSAYGGITAVFLEAVRAHGGVEMLTAAVDPLVTAIGEGDQHAWCRLKDLAEVLQRQDLGAAECRIVIEGCRQVGMDAAVATLLYVLALRSLDGEPAFERWTELVEAVDERPYRWCDRGSAWGYQFTPVRSDDVLPVVDHLLGLDGAIAGLIALSLVGTAASQKGWTDGLRERYPALADHREADVREAARSVLPD